MAKAKITTADKNAAIAAAFDKAFSAVRDVKAETEALKNDAATGMVGVAASLAAIAQQYRKDDYAPDIKAALTRKSGGKEPFAVDVSNYGLMCAAGRDGYFADVRNGAEAYAHRQKTDGKAMDLPVWKIMVEMCRARVRANSNKLSKADSVKFKTHDMTLAGVDAMLAEKAATAAAKAPAASGKAVKLKDMTWPEVVMLMAEITTKSGGKVDTGPVVSQIRAAFQSEFVVGATMPPAPSIPVQPTIAATMAANAAAKPAGAPADLDDMIANKVGAMLDQKLAALLAAKS